MLAETTKEATISITEVARAVSDVAEGAEQQSSQLLNIPLVHTARLRMP
ncbi:hypothetical protein [Paenibacillus aestuarii]|uniref:Methyl-accepting transducer domain-containing protein n=1 Tax=Paenibacillus aestuarii TaxID=516965 RepID=A0ABW0KCI1_9BACL|nr:hypothetical protein [Paenibacillus aestuarii]